MLLNLHQLFLLNDNGFLQKRTSNLHIASGRDKMISSKHNALTYAAAPNFFDILGCFLRRRKSTRKIIYLNGPKIA